MLHGMFEHDHKALCYEHAAFHFAHPGCMPLRACSGATDEAASAGRCAHGLGPNEGRLKVADSNPSRVTELFGVRLLRAGVCAPPLVAGVVK